MFEPEDFLETLDRMILLNQEILTHFAEDEEEGASILLDIHRLRDLHHRIRLQFGLETETFH